MRLLNIVSVLCVAPLAIVYGQRDDDQASDNDLYPPSGLPSFNINSCDFQKAEPCLLFFNSNKNKNANFELAAEDANANTRSMASIRYVTTSRGASGTASFTSRHLLPSITAPRRAFCVSFRYRLTGDASLGLVEHPRGGRVRKFWKDDGDNEQMKGKWRFHTSQVSQDVPTRLVFEATVNGGLSAVAIDDITVYNWTCNIKSGDMLVPYTGESRSVGAPDAPYWTTTTIPYEIQPGFTTDERSLIMRFFSDAFAKTCLRFVPRNSETNYMNFIKMDPGYSCSADLGMVGQTKIMLDEQCFVDGYWNIAHMIMHALGLRHEHVRPDRDNYVNVYPGRVDSTKVAQFNRRASWNNVLLARPYDYNSVMHFFRDQFSADGFSNTIEKKGDPNADLSNLVGPTAEDYQKIAALYCNGVTRSPTTPRPTQPTTSTTPRPAALTPCTTTSVIDGSRGNSGLISNGAAGGIYRANENCGWNVRGDPGKIYTLRFTILDIEDSDGCVKDSVTVYDGSSWETSPIIVNLCGQNRPVENYTTSGSEFLVIFTTDRDTQQGGFRLAYSLVENTPEVGPAADAALSPADCTFESSTCAWAQGTSDLKWVRASGLTQKLPNLPADHTTGVNAGSYLALSASQAYTSNQFAIMRSNRILWGDAFACFSFWYRFVDSASNIGTLQVNYANNNGELKSLWSSATSPNPNAYRQWVNVRINVYDIPDEFYRIIFNGTIRSTGKVGGMAIDSISLFQEDCDSDLPPPIDSPVGTESPFDFGNDNVETTPQPFVDAGNGFSCDFETNYCNWRNATARVDANWIRFAGRSTSGSNFGIQMDNTRQTASGRYLLLNSRSNQKITARLEAQVPANSGYKCLDFFYLMYGQHLGRLRVIARYQNSDQEMLLYEASGNKGPKWTRAQASVDGITSAYTLIVEGFTTGQVDGDIGLDDFLLRPTDCYQEPLRFEAPTTTPYVTPDNQFICDFEDNRLCVNSLQFSNNFGSALQFSTSQGGSGSVAMGGPLNDHSRNNTVGRFAFVRGGFSGSSGALNSKSFSTGQINCLTFWYFMGTNDAGSIRISSIDPQSGAETILYNIGANNRFLNEWVNPQVPTPILRSGTVIRFTATSGGSRFFLALDDVEFSRYSKCSAPMSRVMVPELSRGRRQASGALLSCRFGFGDFCGWTNTNQRWAVVQTSAQQDIAGPDDRFAHLTSGRLIVTAGNSRTFGPSADMTSNITGTLTSETVQISTSRAQQSCFRFYYKIAGWFRALPMDVLNVYIRQSSSSRRRLIASLSGSQSPPTDSLDDWVEQRMTVFESQNYQVIFEGITGDSWIGTIAIDDVQLRTQVCPNAGF